MFNTGVNIGSLLTRVRVRQLDDVQVAGPPLENWPEFLNFLAIVQNPHENNWKWRDVGLFFAMFQAVGSGNVKYGELPNPTVRSL